MKKRGLALIMACAMTASLAGCSGSSSAPADTTAAKTEAAGAEASEGTEAKPGEAAAENKDLSGTITFTIWDNNLNDFIEQNDMVGRFQETYPNADIEVEKIKDDSEYWNAMKMRASGCYV